MQELIHSFQNTPLSSSAYKTARKSIKSKFAAFNATFEDLYNTQRHFSIPDVELRSQLRNDNVEHILANYKKLYDTYEAPRAHISHACIQEQCSVAGCAHACCSLSDATSPSFQFQRRGLLHEPGQVHKGLFIPSSLPPTLAALLSPPFPYRAPLPMHMD